MKPPKNGGKKFIRSEGVLRGGGRKSGQRIRPSWNSPPRPINREKGVGSVKKTAFLTEKKDDSKRGKKNQRKRGRLGTTTEEENSHSGKKELRCRRHLGPQGSALKRSKPSKGRRKPSRTYGGYSKLKKGRRQGSLLGTPHAN